MRGALPASLPGLLADPDGEDPRASLEASLERLAAGRAAIVMASLEDLWLETDPQNVPGTGPERPNWRRRYPWTLEEIERRPDIAATLERIHRAVGARPATRRDRRDRDASRDARSPCRT